MVLFVTSSKAQNKIAQNLKTLRLQQGLTQEGLSKRSGVSLSSLRKFEQKSVISFESFLKLVMALGCLDDVVKATELKEEDFLSIDDVLKETKDKKPQRGWRK